MRAGRDGRITRTEGERRRPGRGVPALCVVKLGGSYAFSDRLPAWLDVLGGFGGSIVLVPGGGPFAERVRDMQRRWSFDDGLAHHLALLAMEQYGRVLAGLRPGLRPAESRSALRRILRGGEIPVWLPTRMVIGRRDVAASWDVTSDSLAVWLAGQIKAPHLCLLKSAPAPTGPLTAAELSVRGMVDAAFPRFLARVSLRAWYVGPQDADRLATGLREAGALGAPIGA